MEVVDGYTGIPPNIIIKAFLLLLDTPPIYLTVLVFGICTALILSLIFAWVHVRSRVGEKI